MFTMASVACRDQNVFLLQPLTPNDGFREQPGRAHFFRSLLKMLIDSEGACLAQNSAVMLMGEPREGRVKQFACAHVLCRRLTIPGIAWRVHISAVRPTKP